MTRRISLSLRLRLILDFIRQNRQAFILAFSLAAVLVVLLTNEPISTRPVEGKFVRLTMLPSRDPPATWIYVDLPDGRTTAIEVWNGWQAPAVGDTVQLEELTLLWFGKNYRLPLIPQTKTASDDPA